MATGTEAATETKPARSLRSRIVRVSLAIVAVLFGAFAYRLTSLRGLPDITPPFDPERDGVVDIRPEDNAFTYYFRAQEKCRDIQSQDIPTTYSNWSEVDQKHFKFIDDNREALGIWFEGTTRERSVYIQPNTFNIMTELPALLSLRNFCHAANLVGYRHEHEGDYAKAWKWYRAALRASRHSGQNGAAIERYIGNAIYAITVPNVIRWAENPRVATDQLKQALKDVFEIDALTGSVRNLIRAEYFNYINSLENSSIRGEALDNLFINASNSTSTFKTKTKARLVAAYGAIRREPKRSKRVFQLVTANWLSAADLPAAERLKLLKMHNELPLYDSPECAKSMRPNELASWYQTTLFARMYLQNWNLLERAMLRDEQTRAALIVHLAEQIYTREKGKSPATPQDLVGPYLQALPAGFDSTGAAIPLVKPAAR